MRSTASSLRIRILDRYIVRELLAPTGIGLLVFTFVLLLQQITILTGILISRGADLETTFQLFYHLLPSILAITIPMAFLLGVLLAFGRLASESEIVAMRASGVSPAQLLRPVLLMSALTTLVTFYVIAVLLPPANAFYRETLYTVILSKARAEMKPRVFNDDMLPGMVLYVSDVASDTGDWKNVFISDIRRPEKPQIILARSGRLVIDDARKRVVLNLQRGSIHSYDRGNPRDYVQEYFTSAEFPLRFDQLFPKIPLAKGSREMTIPELLDSIGASEKRVQSLRSQQRLLELQSEQLKLATYRVDLHRKFTIPIACFVFGMLGLGLSLGNRKEARSAAFGLSIAVISIYYIFLRLGEQAADTGLVDPWLGTWAANIVLGAAGVVLIVLNQREAAFDPLNPFHYTSWLPRVTRRHRPVAGRAMASRGSAPTLRPVNFLPSLLDRYIGRQFTAFLGLIIVAFWCIFFLFDFMDRIDDVRQNHVKGAVVMHYYAFFSPEIIHLVLPLALLVSTLATFGVMARRNEITAIKAGGISVYRATIPILVMGILGSGVLFALGEYLLPHTNKIAARDLNEIKGRTAQSSSVLERRWIMTAKGRIYNYDYMSGGDGVGLGAVGAVHASPNAPPSFYGLSVFDVDAATWTLRERVYVGHAVWAGGGAYEIEAPKVHSADQRRSQPGGWRWAFRGGRDVRFEELGTAAGGDKEYLRGAEPPTFFIRQDPGSASMGFMELRAHIASLETLGVDVAKLKVQLYQKIAFPLVGLIMTLLGIRFSFTVGRRGALYGIGLSIFIGMTYLVCMRLAEAMGNNAVLPPMLAAWAPNILFGAWGFYLMLTLET